MDLMKSIPSKSVDMILCDLPYGVTRNKSDIKLPLNDLWTLYENIITDTGVIALFAQQLFYVDLVNSNRKLFRVLLRLRDFFFFRSQCCIAGLGCDVT